MSDNGIKQIRGQIRQIVKDILPTVFTTELAREIQKQLGKQLSDTMAALTKQITDRLDVMEAKQKTIHASFIRNVLAPAQHLPNNIAAEGAPEKSTEVQS